MAYILCFDKNHDFSHVEVQKYAADCPALFNVAFSMVDHLFLVGFDFLHSAPSNDFPIITKENLPNKIKTFLLLGGAENAITNYTGDHNN